jgi:hypothetical protein
MQWFLAGLFAVHLLAFGRLWRKRRKLRYIRLAILFAALTIHYVMRAVDANPTVAGVEVPMALRALAWTLAAWSLIELVARRRAKKR